MLVSNKKEQTKDLVCNNVDISQNIILMEENPNRKEHILYYPHFMKLRKSKTYRKI